MHIGTHVIGTAMSGVKRVGILVRVEPRSYTGDLPYLVKTTHNGEFWCTHVIPHKTALLRDYFKNP